MDNEPKIYWIRGHLWQHVQFLQPVEAKDEEEAMKRFREATATARDVVVQGLAEDPEELIGPQYGDEVIDTPDETPHTLN